MADERFTHLIGTPKETLDSVPSIPPDFKFPSKEPSQSPSEPVREFSPIDLEFLTDLSNVFSEQGPRWGETYDALLYRAGQRSVVEWLIAEYNAQQQKGAASVQSP